MIARFRSGGVAVGILIGLSLSLATAHAVAPEWSETVGLDVWNLPTASEQLRQANEEGAELQSRMERWAKRRVIADHIALQLSHGLSLSAAVDELMDVYQHEPEMIAILECSHRGAPSVRHLFALHAISRVKALVTDPAERALVLSQLEAEYKTLSASLKPTPAH